jgi:hypothetical protein
LAAFLAPFFLPPFFAAFFLVAILSFLLLELSYDHKMLCCCSSCGQEKTAHNMLLYKLNSQPCQQFITAREIFFGVISDVVATEATRARDCGNTKRAIERDRYLRMMKRNLMRLTTR